MKDYTVLDELVPKTEELHKAIDNVYEQGYRDGHNDYAEINKDVYDEAYQKGIEEGSADAKILIENAYRRGLEDAWYVFRIVVKPSMCGGLDIDEMIQIFGTSIHKDIADLSPQDAIEKIKAWKQKKEQRYCSIAEVICPYEIPCEDCEVHGSMKRVKTRARENLRTGEE